MTYQIDLNSAKLPPVPKKLDIDFPFGASLGGFGDFSQGLPDDGALAFNLIGQLAPMMGVMGCLFKIMGVMDKLKTFMSVMGPPELPDTPIDKLAELKEAAQEIIPEIEKVLKCYPPLAQLEFVSMVKGIVEMVLRLLDALVVQLENVLEHTKKIKEINAEGNPALKKALEIAQGNADLTVEHLMASLGPVQPILKIATDLSEMIESPVKLPSLTDLAASEDLDETIKTVRQTIDTMKQVVESLPG